MAEFTVEYPDDLLVTSGKTLEQIVHHVAEDSLVATAWNPGEGRMKPPLTHAGFAAKVREWVDKGAATSE